MTNYASLIIHSLNVLYPKHSLNERHIETNFHNGTLFVALSVAKSNILTFEKYVPDLQNALLGIPDITKALITLTAHANEPETEPQKRGTIAPQNPIPHVKHIIAISSAKGGVGKSTITANLAVSLAKMGLNIGVLDVDIYGPSQPTLFGVAHEKPTLKDDGVTLLPVEAHGVKLMSIGFLLNESDALIWRGPMVISAITQLLYEVEWGTTDKPLDILILDLPPGTGDAHLSIVQKVPLTGVVIISTPQEMALADVRRGITMFNKVNVPIIGLVQNMQLYACEKCGHEVELFGASGASKEAARHGIPLIATLPISFDLRTASDSGTPMTAKPNDNAIPNEFNLIAKCILSYLKY